MANIRETLYSFRYISTVQATVFALRKISRQFDDFEEPLERAVKEVLMPSFGHNFEVGGRPKWAPLADFTVNKKAESGADPRINIEWGALFDVMQSDFGVWQITKDEASVPTNVPGAEYANIIQEGRRAIIGSAAPARPFAIAQEEDQNAIGEILDDWIVDVFHSNGWR